MSEQNQIIDLLVVGGGINGAGIAADASGRGLTVMLCEQNDLASATSSASSKLIHGGLRYLEQFEFRLVREALHEREILLRKAPHIIWPLHFILPHSAELRPAWLIRLGLFLYDHLSTRKLLAKSHAANLCKHKSGKSLQQQFKKGFIYSDCWVDDARLVILNAMTAKKNGARILTRTKVLSAQRQNKLWHIVVQNTDTGKTHTVQAQVLVNATGPWVETFSRENVGIAPNNRVALVKGSHFVIPKLYEGEEAFILQNSDQRIIFVIPFLQQYSLIGTTETPFTENNPHDCNITTEEIMYLCKAVNRYFSKQISAQDIVWSYSGVRALKQETSKDMRTTTREYELELDKQQGQAPLLSVFGGKITTYRKLAEQALDILSDFFPHCGSSWTAHTRLPGGDLPNLNFDDYLKQLQTDYPWLPKHLTYRYARGYGTLVKQILQDAKSRSDLGKDFGAELYQCEIKYLVQNEWAKDAEDILWRRTKLGLDFPTANITQLNQFIAQLRREGD